MYELSGQIYKGFTILIYDSSVMMTEKMTLVWLWSRKFTIVEPS